MASHLSDQIYKGLALVTPGGDLVYAIDPTKQRHWHAQLCAALQEQLNLSEAPLFLTPSHTATVDRWIDPSQQVCMVAEAYPAVWRYRIFLQTIFDVPVQQWRGVTTDESPAVIQSYRERFPQLWQSHNLVLRVQESEVSAAQPLEERNLQSYVLHLFIAGQTPKTARMLEVLHQVLETFTCPYTLKIIDVIQHPDQAEAAQVLATPTLVRIWPQPMRQVVGALEHPQKILELLMT